MAGGIDRVPIQDGVPLKSAQSLSFNDYFSKELKFKGKKEQSKRGI
jgi:hypothetical protein